MNNSQIQPLILCGGTGSRLWPLSRKSFPKQFLKCDPESENSFLQETFLRLKNIRNLQNPILICNEEHRFLAAEQMREIEVKTNAIILEPAPRNTAPAIVLGSLIAKRFQNDPLILVLPADHSIKNISKFNKVINEGIKYAKDGSIVTFGISPKYPATGFGYIEALEPFKDNNINGIGIKKFIEKPDKKTAKQLFSNEKFSWNSGIFLMSANVVLEQFKLYNPEILSKCENCINHSKTDLDFIRIPQDDFIKCPDIPFDIAIMENTNLGVVLPLDIEWSDVGSWDSFWEISKKDKEGNVLQGSVIQNKIKNCFIRSESKLVVGIDIEDLVVVETSDAVLVTKKESSQKVKNIVDQMISNNYKSATEHLKTYRPWGSYLSLAEGEGWQVKRIIVKPGESLSLQKHNHRTEHWIIVSGQALVEVENEKKFLSRNESTYIPLGSKHRLSNPGLKPLILIEVQSGNYLGEDDIIRYEDNYGRKNNGI